MKLKKLTLAILAFMTLTGCGEQTSTSSTKSTEPASSVTTDTNTPSEDSSVKNVWVVTFDENYTGGKKTPVEVTKGMNVTPVTDPSRTGYIFLGWYTAASDGTEVDFSATITGDVTYYAHWEEGDESNTVTITYDNNYENGGVYLTKKQKKKRRATQPTDPSRDGYRFAGWYDDAACTTSHVWTQTISENITLYAKWLKEYVFEAEYTDLEGKAGLGYSGNCSDIELVQQDIYNGGASNGFYLSWLYYNGAFVEWKINSTVAVSDVWITARLSVEFFDMALNQDTYQTYVNGTLQTEKYNIDLSGAVAAGTKAIRPFKDYVLNTKVSLNAGVNSIKLVTNNDNYYTGTMSASSPMVDCIKVATNDATLTWDTEAGYPFTTNTRLFN